MAERKESVLTTWLFIALLLVYFLACSLFAYLVVGEQGQPDWDYRPVNDVPASSPYAIYEKLPNPQHVKGSEGE